MPPMKRAVEAELWRGIWRQAGPFLIGALPVAMARQRETAVGRRHHGPALPARRLAIAAAVGFPESMARW
jgi:hypothetical protein